MKRYWTWTKGWVEILSDDDTRRPYNKPGSDYTLVKSSEILVTWEKLSVC